MARQDVLISMRYTGNILLVLGHFFLLEVNSTLGVLIKLGAVLLTLPYFIKYKFYDVIFLSSLFTLIELYSLL